MRVALLALVVLLLAAPAAASPVVYPGQVFSASGTFEHATGSAVGACTVAALQGVNSNCVALPEDYSGLQFSVVFTSGVGSGKARACFFDAAKAPLGCPTPGMYGALLVPAGSAFAEISGDPVKVYAYWYFQVYTGVK